MTIPRQRDYYNRGLLIQCVIWEQPWRWSSQLTQNDTHYKKVNFATSDLINFRSGVWKFYSWKRKIFTTLTFFYTTPKNYFSFVDGHQKHEKFPLRMFSESGRMETQTKWRYFVTTYTECSGKNVYILLQIISIDIMLYFYMNMLIFLLLIPVKI